MSTVLARVADEIARCGWFVEWRILAFLDGVVASFVVRRHGVKVAVLASLIEVFGRASAVERVAASRAKMVMGEELREVVDEMPRTFRERRRRDVVARHGLSAVVIAEGVRLASASSPDFPVPNGEVNSGHGALIGLHYAIKRPDLIHARLDRKRLFDGLGEVTFV